MTTYAIGDVRGKLQALLNLLNIIQFDIEKDTLWFTGNLVNDGPDSLEVLRFIKGLGKQAITVLGDQELRLLGVAEGVLTTTEDDVFDEILSASDRDEILKWLCQRPLLHHDEGFTLVHAGIPAEWSLSQAQTFAMEVESTLTLGNRKTFLENIFADDPTRWHAKHRGWKRVRFIVNAFTRMRYCNRNGRLDFTTLKPDEIPPEDCIPWYQVNERLMAKQNIIFGYWPLFNSGILENTNAENWENNCIPTRLFSLNSINRHGSSLCAMAVNSTPELILVP